MKRTVLVFGLIAGGIVSIFMGTSMAIMSCSESTDHGVMSMVVGYAAMLIAFAFVFVGVKSHRDKVQGGTITFGRGLSIGLLIAFIASTLYVITWSIEYHFFIPDFMDGYWDQMAAGIDTVGKTPVEIETLRTEAIAQAAKMKAEYDQPMYFTLWTYAEILPLGILVALISAAILRRKPKSPLTA